MTSTEMFDRALLPFLVLCIEVLNNHRFKVNLLMEVKVEVFKNFIHRSLSWRRIHISSFSDHCCILSLILLSGNGSVPSGFWREFFAKLRLTAKALLTPGLFFLPLPPASSSAGNLWLQMVGWTYLNVSNYQTRKKLGFLKTFLFLSD